MKNLLKVFCSVAMLTVFLCSPQLTFAENSSAGLIKEDFGSLQYSFPAAKGWSSEKLARAMLYAQEIGSSAVVVLHKGKLVLEWGRTTLRINSHSVRKSLLSALYGVAVQKNLIDVSLTLKSLGIDDRPPCLSDSEKQATVLDLLKSRSGIFHEAAYETAGMKRVRPSRGSFNVGEHWYYNNWDFNVLGTIFERRTNMTIGQAFQEWIADPIGMQDFRAEDVHYRWEDASLHPAYPFWVTARDLARFGQLYLQNGAWNGEEVISNDWIKESTTSYSDTSHGGYGYMWWIHPSGAYYAHGHMGQFILVIPDQELVVVNRVFTGTPSFNRIPTEVVSELQGIVRPINVDQFKKLVDEILEAAPSRQKQ